MFIYALILVCIFYYISFSHVCLFVTATIFYTFSLLLSGFDRNYSSYQFLQVYLLGKSSDVSFLLGWGLDGTSLGLSMLTALLFFLIFLTQWKYNLLFPQEFSVSFLCLEVFLILSFLCLDILTFFFLFESVLFPMFIIIGVWGSLHRKVYASLLFYLCTMAGSFCLLYVIVNIYSDVGSLNFSLLSKMALNYHKQALMWPLVFIAFVIKVPSIPFHIWLPEAHVEAPSGGSVVLAGVLLKLGGYGLLRILFPIFSFGTVFYWPAAGLVGVSSVFYASVLIFRQLDLKRIIAFSSIAHMNLAILGIFGVNIEGLLGASFLFVGHGLVSGLLFFLVGFLYDRYSSRTILYYGGLLKVMPVFSSYLFFACLSNFGLPGTCNFIGEIYLFFCLVQRNVMVFLLLLISIIFSAVYSLYLFMRLCYGNLTSYLQVFSDLFYTEHCISSVLAGFILWFGLVPNSLLDVLAPSLGLLGEKIK